MLTIRKFLFRGGVATVVFLLVKLTMENTASEGTERSSIFYFLSALSFFIIIWEINDFYIKSQLEKTPNTALDWKNSLIILNKTLLISIPIIALVYYLAIFHFPELTGCKTNDSWRQFSSDFLRALLLSITVIIFNLFYFASKLRKNMSEKLVRLEKEMAVSQYQNLENQLSPHFLFNSLNTLTSLMYEDRDLASDFVARLSACYRYILDHRNKPTVSLDKELNFLDSFIFMMNVRHRMSLHISSEVTIKSSEYSIPTLSLQMLVENALKHNYYSAESPLIIKVYDENHYLVVENTLRPKSEQPSMGIGLANIKSRFSHYTNKTVKVERTTQLFRVAIPLLDINETMTIEHLRIATS